MKTLKKTLRIFLAAMTLFALPINASAAFYNDPVPGSHQYGEDGALPIKYARQFKFESVTAEGFKQTLNYRLYVPEDYDESKSYPVLMFLHGYGETDNGENTNVAQLNIGMMTQFFTKGYYRRFPCIIIAPQCPKGGQWAVQGYKGSYTIDASGKTGNTFTEAIQLCKKAVEKTAAEYSVDTDRLYVTGLSMGGYGTWNIITHYPDYFAAALPICGGGDPKLASRLTDIPIWCFHGDKDTSVPVSGSRDMYNAIVNAGGSKISYTEWPGLGHVWYPAYCREDVWEWVFAQGKSQADPSVLNEDIAYLKSLDSSKLNEELKTKVEDALSYAEGVQNGQVHTNAMVSSAQKLLQDAVKQTKTASVLPKILIAGACALALAAAGIVTAVILKKKKRT